MGKYKMLAGLLTQLAGLIGVATADLELAQAALELKHARQAGGSATREADSTNNETGLATPRATRRAVEQTAERRSRGAAAHPLPFPASASRSRLITDDAFVRASAHPVPWPR
jgi:hypothetical protein